MLNLSTLPDDIVLLVLEHLHIDDFFALRLTCASLSGLLVHPAYLPTIARCIARNTFPACTLEFNPPATSSPTFNWLSWLKRLIPAHLSAIALDKDKARRYPYVHAGFPYGIPCDAGDDQARYWRARVARGFRVLQAFHLVSKDVYAKTGDPNAVRKLPKLAVESLAKEKPKSKRKKDRGEVRKIPGGLKSTKIYQWASCSYQGCEEHAAGNLFSYFTGRDINTHLAQIREKIILRKRFELLDRLKDRELEDYLLVWRLLIWTFRPYCRPGSSQSSMSSGTPCGEKDVDMVEDIVSESKEMARSKDDDVNWQAEISSISQGCSWLSWFVLYVGADIFWKQWWSGNSPAPSNHSAVLSPPAEFVNTPKQQPHRPKHQNYVRDLIHHAWHGRSHHRISLEREYLSKFEFTLRKRCLTRERRKRLDWEMLNGCVIKTISLDCIPWEYDRSPYVVVDVGPERFPWYKPGQWVWLGALTWMKVGPGVMHVMQEEMVREESGVVVGEEAMDLEKGPLEHVPFLVYLGSKEATDVWQDEWAEVEQGFQMLL